MTESERVAGPDQPPASPIAGKVEMSRAAWGLGV